MLHVIVDRLKAVSASEDCTIRIWEINEPHVGRCCRTLHTTCIPRTLALPSAYMVLAGLADGTVSCILFGRNAQKYGEKGVHPSKGRSNKGGNARRIASDRLHDVLND